MKKFITAAAFLAASTALASAATLVADWSDFTSLTSGDYTLMTSGSTSVSDGVLNVVGAANGTANVDLTAAGLTLTDGFSVSMKVSNIGSFGGVGPYSLMAVASSEQSYLALAGVATTNNNSVASSIKFAFGGSATNITSATTGTASPSVLQEDTVSLVTVTFAAGTIRLYLDGDELATGTTSTTTYDNQTISQLTLGSWAGNSSNGRLSESVHSLSVYDGVLTAAEVKALAAVPEPSAFGLLAGVGALALVAARRRRSRAK